MMSFEQEKSLSGDQNAIKGSNTNAGRVLRMDYTETYENARHKELLEVLGKLDLDGKHI